VKKKKIEKDWGGKKRRCTKELFGQDEDAMEGEQLGEEDWEGEGATRRGRASHIGKRLGPKKETLPVKKKTLGQTRGWIR